MSEKRAYVSEADYARRMKETVLPYLNARRYDGYFAGYDGNVLQFVTSSAGGGDGGAETAQKTAIISHGFTESAEKWRELAFYFLQEGYNVYIPEHRGHGLSYRKTADKTLTHIDRFSEYADDFEIFCDTVRAETTGEIYLYAHSMGCAIGMLFMERHPAFFKKAFLSSPMVVPNPGKVPLWLARLLMKIARLFLRRIPATKNSKILRALRGRGSTNTTSSSARTKIIRIILPRTGGCTIRLSRGS